MKFMYSFAFVLAVSCSIISSGTPPAQCSAVIDAFLAASNCAGSGKVNCYSHFSLGDPAIDFTSRDLVYIDAIKTFDTADSKYDCCYTYESRAPEQRRDDCDPKLPFESISQSHFILDIDCDDFDNQLTHVNGGSSSAVCGGAIKVDHECNGGVGNPCTYEFCFKWDGMTATDQCCTSPGFYSIKNGNTDAFACVTIPTCTCTDSPTEHPTESPSKSPSKNPSKSPTKSPSKDPTESPSKFPTKNPSKSPSKFPTESPTESPSKFPTKDPSKSPSKFPTKDPTKDPSQYPSKNPTKLPSKFPTKNPSKSPSKFPTKPPTKSPSKFPTKDPSKSPSKFPTKDPSKSPSKFPTKNPTKSPTDDPSKSPTKYPSKSPTKYPSKSPTKYPSKSPSKFPTKNPSKFPTKNPTKSPTKFPTKNPTKSPTSCPNISEDNGPLDTCIEQSNCINVISTAKDGGNQYEICIEWNVDATCRKKGCISYACNGPNEEDKTNSIGWLPYTQLCRTINCGAIATFGIKDGKTCSGTWTNTTKNVASIECYARTDLQGNPTDICNGESHGCTWEFVAPDCKAAGAYVDEEIRNKNSMKKIDEYNDKYNYKSIGYCILGVVIALVLVLIGVTKLWCYYKKKQNRFCYSSVVEMEKRQDVEPMDETSMLDCHCT